MPRWRRYGPGNPLLTDTHPRVHSVRYLRPPGHWFRRWEGLSMGMSLVGPAARLHAERPFDAILACPLIPDGIAALSVKECLGLPLVSLAVGSDILVYPRRMPSLERALRDLMARTDLAIGVSQSLCRDMAALGARAPHCVTLATDTEVFKPARDKAALRRDLGLPQDAVIAIYVGRLARSKGILELAEAAQALGRVHPDWRLVCLGDGPQRASLASPAVPAILAGEQAPEAVCAYLQSADFLVHPSHTEGMPQAVLEGMHCGLPVVATRVGGVPEAVAEGENGLLVRPRDAAALGAAMKRMITEQIFRQRAGRRSLEIVAQHFDANAHTAALVRALQDLKVSGCRVS
jgi:glycosyltransferase involved in cell wall biosynthesis